MSVGRAMFRPQDEIRVFHSPNNINLSSSGGLASPPPELTHINISPTNKVKTEQGRDTWGGRLEFLLTCVAFAVGLGNVWRFPYLAYRHGGGAFLIPYIFFLTFLGLPLFFLELAIGQYASLGPISVWKLCCPLFKGLGYTMIATSMLIAVCYNVIIGYTLYYLFASFTKELPWSHCNNTWNTAFCHEDARFRHNSHNFTLTANMSAMQTSSANVTEIRWRSPAEEYWWHEVLKLESGIDFGHLGGVRWHLCLCLLLAWIIVFLCIIKGIRTSGKVVYFTALFPYFVLISLFFRGITLPGAAQGIEYYLKPDIHKLRSVAVWKDAAVQILYSLGAGSGGLLAMSSYNKFHNNCLQDAVIVTVINCGTSVFAGFVVFSVLGYMAHINNVHMDHVLQGGPGLAFIVYPEAICHMKGSVFWSIAFFFMLFTLGLGSQFPGIECISTAFADEFPLLQKYKPFFTAFICSVMFLAGLSCVTQGGQFVVTLIDTYCTAFPLLIIITLECIVLAWLYGYKRFAINIELMIGYKPNIYWMGCWIIATPLLAIIILIASCVEYEVVAYQMAGVDVVFPDWAEAIRWLITLAAIAPIPVWMAIQVYKSVGSCRTGSRGPADSLKNRNVRNILKAKQERELPCYTDLILAYLFGQNLMWVMKGPATVKSLRLGTLIKPADCWGPAIPQSSTQQHTTTATATDKEQMPIVPDEEEPATDDIIVSPTHVQYNTDSYI